MYNTNNNWKLVTYRNYNSILLAYKKLIPILEHVKILESNYDLSNHSINFLPIVNTLKNDIQSKISTLPIKRSKRGIINAGGSILRSLFGTMDNDDRKQISHLIKSVQNKEIKIEDLLERQIHVTTEAMDVYNTTIRELYNNNVIINQTLKKFQNIVYSTKTDLIHLENHQTITELYEYIINNLIIINDKLEELVNAIDSSYSGLLPVNILNHNNLIKELCKSPQVSKFVEWPSVSNIHNIIKTSQFNAYLDDLTFVSIIEIPLIDDDVLNVYQILSLPKQDNYTISKSNTYNGTYLYHTLLVQNKYIAITKDGRFYTTLEELSTCKTYTSSKLICNSLIIHDENAEPTCETAILKHDNTNYNIYCKIMTTRGNFKIIKHLRKNTWLLLFTDSVNIIEVCNNNGSTTNKFSGTGILTIPENCITTVHTTKLKSESQTKFEIKLQLPEIKIDIMDEVYNHPLIKHIEEVTIKPIQNGNLNLDKLNPAAYEMKNIHRELEKIRQYDPPNSYMHTNHILIYIITISIVGYVIYRCCCNNRVIAPILGHCKSSRCPGRRQRRAEDIEMEPQEDE